MATDTERFGTVPLFDDLEGMQIAELLEISNGIPTKVGDVIIEEGATGDGLYIISKGAFAVIKSDGDSETVLTHLGELSFFGEMSLISKAPCAATVRCTEPGRVTHLPAAAFNARLDDNDLNAFKVVRSIACILANRLAKADDWVANLSD
ncbi:MAG: cyclic nucleotide-binding domain-containing protein [Lentisphaeria bacterium]|jgi:CRP-like cAMP-binding protein|nr:cyclic nucleotide-binding domain-containing protein [Lentisphaeria bacterium]MDP7742033.1 cyclic nucleotide-binding domain-containing protein [Lentisphaeria bacterium]